MALWISGRTFDAIIPKVGAVLIGGFFERGIGTPSGVSVV